MAAAPDKWQADSLTAPEFRLARDYERALEVESRLSLGEVQKILESQTWIFAKSMPKNPHWYTLRHKWNYDSLFVDAILFIRGSHSQKEIFWRKEYTYLEVGGFKYWTMGYPCVPAPYDPELHTMLINRKPVSPEKIEECRHPVVKVEKKKQNQPGLF